MRIAQNYYKRKSNEHRSTSPKAPPPRQVKVRANDRQDCRVRFTVAEKEHPTSQIPPEKMLSTWTSWEVLNTPKALSKYRRRRANDERRKVEENEEANDIEQMWATIDEERAIKVAQSSTKRKEMAAATIETTESKLKRQLFELTSNLQRKKESVNIMESITEEQDDHNDNEPDDDAMRQAVLDGTIATGIADAGCTSHCAIPITSNCGKYEINNNPFIPTGRKSNKIFSMATGNIAPADDIMRLRMPIRSPADEINIVPGIKHNLLSMNQFAESKYITIFDEEEVNIYDATNTKVTVSRGAILRGWRLPEEGLWRIPLVPEVKNLNTDTVLMNKPPTDYLDTEKPPPIDQILNVYELKKTTRTRAILSRRGWISYKTNMASGNKKQTLRFLDGTELRGSVKALSRIRGDMERTRTKNKIWPQINQASISG